MVPKHASERASESPRICDPPSLLFAGRMNVEGRTGRRDGGAECGNEKIKAEGKIQPAM